MEKFKELLALMVYTQYISQSSINKKTKTQENQTEGKQQVISSSSSWGIGMQKL